MCRCGPGPPHYRPPPSRPCSPVLLAAGRWSHRPPPPAVPAAAPRCPPHPAAGPRAHPCCPRGSLPSCSTRPRSASTRRRAQRTTAHNAAHACRRGSPPRARAQHHVLPRWSSCAVGVGRGQGGVWATSHWGGGSALQRRSAHPPVTPAPAHRCSASCCSITSRSRGFEAAQGVQVRQGHDRLLLAHQVWVEGGGGGGCARSPCAAPACHTAAAACTPRRCRSAPAAAASLAARRPPQPAAACGAPPPVD